MSTRHFLYQLAIERCQHNLAQLCAIAHLDDFSDEVRTDTVLSLIESLNRDFDIVKNLPHQWFDPDDRMANPDE